MSFQTKPVSSVSQVINEIVDSITERKPGSGRPKSVRTQQNIEWVSDQDDENRKRNWYTKVVGSTYCKARFTT